MNDNSEGVGKAVSTMNDKRGVRHEVCKMNDVCENVKQSFQQSVKASVVGI